jgi:hypothetical protein
MTDAINTTSTEVAAAAAIVTRKAAYYQITLAEARVEKAREQIAIATARINELNELIPTLPEQVVVDSRVYTVGESITFNAGRGPTRKQLVGVVAAVKNKEDGKVEAYRISVGEGFEAELYTALPGSVVRADGTASDDTDAPQLDGTGEASADDILNDIGNA